LVLGKVSASGMPGACRVTMGLLSCPKTSSATSFHDC
jgi:hypothetical protein